MMATVLAILALLAPSLQIVQLLIGLRPHWSKARAALISAAIVPGLLMVPVSFVFVTAFTSPPERCGVDACGMAFVAAIYLSGILLAVFVVGLVLCLISASFRKRTKRADIGDTFT